MEVLELPARTLREKRCLEFDTLYIFNPRARTRQNA